MKKIQICLSIVHKLRQKIKSQMQIVPVLIGIVLAVSTYMLINLINIPEQQLDVTSKLRFFCLIGVNVIIFISSLVSTKLKTIYSLVVLFCCSCLIIAIAITGCQIVVKHIENQRQYNYMKNDGTYKNQELTFLTLYFITYMTSIIGCILSFLFIIATQILLRVEEKKVNEAVSKHLIERKQGGEFIGEECPICLQKVNDNREIYVETKSCGHIFHRKCLIQWIKQNKTCPLCRAPLFSSDQDDTREVAQF